MLLRLAQFEALAGVVQGCEGGVVGGARAGAEGGVEGCGGGEHARAQLQHMC